MRTLCVVFALLGAGPVLAQVSSGSADAGVASEVPMESGAEQLQQLSAQVAGLKRQLDEERAHRESSSSVLETLKAGLEALEKKPLGISALGVDLTLTGFVQSDFQWRQSSEEQLDSATGAPLNETRFLIRRARLKPQIDYRFISGSLEADFNTVQGTQVRLVGAEVSARYQPDPKRTPAVMGTAGMFKTPFGFEVLQSDRDRLFAERSNVVRALFPGEYDLGLRLQGQWRFLTYSAALLNGHPLGDKSLPARAPVAPRDGVFRIGVDARPLDSLRVEAGASGVVGTGFHAGTAPTKDQIVWRDINGDNVAQLGELQILPGEPAQASSTFPRQAVGGDFRVTLSLWSLGETRLFGELIWAKNLDRGLVVSDPVAAGRDLRGLGWHLGFSQGLSQWFLLGLRYDRYNPDLDALDGRAGQVLPKDQTFSTLAVTAAFVYRPVFRFLVEYDHNTNALGRNAQGVPTSLADDAVIARAEVSF